MTVCVALTAAGMSAACQRDEGPSLVLRHRDGTPAAGVSLWCEWFATLPNREGGRLSGPPNHWRHARSDAEGRVTFAGAPPDCSLNADGYVTEPRSLSPDAKPPHRVVVTRSMRCTSALAVVRGEAGWHLAWLRPGKGYSAITEANDAGLVEAARRLWTENGARREPADHQRDCAWVVEGASAMAAARALSEVSRPMLEVRPGGPDGYTIDAHPFPALQITVVDAATLCTLAGKAPPPAWTAALGDHPDCRP